MGWRQEVWTGRSWLGPLLLVGGWQRGRGTQVELGNISHQRQGQLVEGRGITVHFPCRLGVGVRTSETCTPTQEETGLRLFESPQSGVWSGFLQ
jgi:hypothetical protein